ncbi:polyprenyl synthetase family protein [bacterium]|nr:polyprenyl synthetase family protein [bacterium]
MSFKEDYKNIYNLVGDELEKVKTKAAENITAQNKFYESLSDFVKAPSKHIRALVSFLYCKAASYEITEEQIIFQAIIELIHNGSLIHDDVIDASGERRGNKSFNANFGEHLSVVAGDYVLATALRYIAELKNSQLTIMIADTISKMCEGEVRQHHSKYKIPTLEEYLEKTYNKTGALFEAAICGAELLATNKISEQTAVFSKNFGIAFQIKNDIKNVIANKKDSDINNGIYTAPVIFAGDLENAASGIEKAYDLLDNYIRKAKASAQYLPDSLYKQAVIELTGIIRDE